MITTNQKVRVKSPLLQEENLWSVKEIKNPNGKSVAVCMALMDAGGYQETQEEEFFISDLEKV